MKTRRTDIQKAAYDLVGLQGLEALTARNVAQELQINHATVHYYFPHRDDLLHGVADFALEQFRRDREKFNEGARTPNEKLESELELAEAYCKKTSRFVKVLAGLYVASVANVSLRKKLQALWKEWHVTLAELTKSAKLKKDTPFRDADLLQTTLFGAALASQMLDGKYDAKAVVDEVYRSALG
jgi:AcrR family transcriptional regulator